MIQGIMASASASALTNVRQVCATLEVSPSGFDAHRHKEQRPRCQENRILRGELHSAFEQSYSTYGTLRLVKALRERGVFTSKTRPGGTRCVV